ncbi:MAG: hypothetical protein JXK94_02295 [Deltaproteobacteria bacterium]|nr:hypothetical protein [Deltaproteobacteria bacterium]
MIAFEIVKNGKKIATVGMDKAGTLAVSTVRGKHLLSNFPEDYQDEIKKISNAEEFEKENFVLSVEGNLEGRTKDNNLTWYRGHLTAGDEITIRLVEADTVDEPRVVASKVVKSSLF